LLAEEKYPKRKAPGALIGCADPLRSGQASGFAFLLVLFFGEAKKSTATSGKTTSSASNQT
jgi:hypothetical protein